mmetsp:Transcript_14652/g.19174  ORF Transcript_14652/g.19174 Transcript_14652/m.19174 type:complete len:195 (-) Transcript_14652:324-908(-)
MEEQKQNNKGWLRCCAEDDSMEEVPKSNYILVEDIKPTEEMLVEAKGENFEDEHKTSEKAHDQPTATQSDLLKDQLLQGITVKKFPRSGMKSSKTITLSCDQDFTQISWTSTSKDGGRTSVRLADITEVRLANDMDRSDPEFNGTKTLRKRCKFEDADKCASLIWEERTLDLQFESVDACQEFVQRMRDTISQK